MLFSFFAGKLLVDSGLECFMFIFTDLKSNKTLYYRINITACVVCAIAELKCVKES